MPEGVLVVFVDGEGDDATERSGGRCWSMNGVQRGLQKEKHFVWAVLGGANVVLL